MNNIKLLENILSDLQKQEFDPAKKNLEDLVNKRKIHLDSLNNKKNNSQEQSSSSDGNAKLVVLTMNSVGLKKRKKSSKGKLINIKKASCWRMKIKYKKFLCSTHLQTSGLIILK